MSNGEHYPPTFDYQKYERFARKARGDYTGGVCMPLHLVYPATKKHGPMYLGGCSPYIPIRVPREQLQMNVPPIYYPIEDKAWLERRFY
jgi:hypothetical protein